MNTFSAGSCIALGWETFKKRPWFLIGAPLLALVIFVLISLALTEVQKLGVVLAILVFFVNIYISTVYKMGATNFVLKAVADTSSLQAMDYWHLHPFWKYLGAGVLTALCVIGAMIVALAVAGIVSGLVYLAAGTTAAGICFVALMIVCAIVAEFYIVTMLFFVRYIVIDRELGPVVTLTESARITKGYRWMLLWLMILCLLLNVIGFVCLLVGLFVTIPVTSLAMVHAYRMLGQKTGTPAPAV